MRAALRHAAKQLSVRASGPPVYGWHDRSIGSPATTPTGDTVWLRVVSELSTWAGGLYWDGNTAAAHLEGVAKPAVTGTADWARGDRWYRAETMTYITDRPVSPTPELTTNPRLDDDWWQQLTASLDALAAQPTERVHIGQQQVTRRLRQYYADRTDPTVDYWVTAHTDLHWNNLTRPRCHLLDWEGWGAAPLGYDQATLYCHSLPVPAVAAEVRDRFADVLETPDGTRSLLLVAARMLNRSGHGDYPELVVPLHRLADELTGR